MRVLVAGASGAVGIRLIRILVAAGHRVTGLTRSPSKAEPLRRAGATPVVVDALDPPALREAVLGAQPEVVVHEMSSLADATDLRQFDRAFAQTNRLRTEGLDHLLGAAREVGANKVVAQSYCGWPFARVGGPVKTEDDPLDSRPPREFQRSLEAIRHLESSVTEATEFEGVVLRYGAFYGPGSGLFDGSALDQLRRRLFPVIGDGGGWWSFVHLDDAAEATARAIESGPRDLQCRGRRSRAGPRLASGPCGDDRGKAAATHSAVACSLPSRRAYGRDDDGN
jgi:nucleoside-diphosphate-sugar epimerase